MSTATIARLKRPAPPAEALELAPDVFVPAPDVAGWMRETFIVTDGALYNPDHDHLETATIGVVWTNVPNRRQMLYVLGQAEIPMHRSGRWQAGRHDQQLEEWFGSFPDFVITLYAPHLAKLSDRAFCAIVEHELYHCAHATTDLGAPRFRRDGRPVFGIRGHDVEEFTGVVRRYGASGPVREMVDAAAAGPDLSADEIAGACGTCGGGVG